MNPSTWLEDFEETCQDIMEDAFLLDALALYTVNGGSFLQGERGEYFPRVFYRLSNYLSQHVLELHQLEKRSGAGHL